MMPIDQPHYYPIRTRMFWVGLIAFLANGISLFLLSFGIDVDITPWAAWLVGGVDLLVTVGAIAVGTTHAERNTTPVTDEGVPLNPGYVKTESVS